MPCSQPPGRNWKTGTDRGRGAGAPDTDRLPPADGTDTGLRFLSCVCCWDARWRLWDALVELVRGRGAESIPWALQGGAGACLTRCAHVTLALSLLVSVPRSCCPSARPPPRSFPAASPTSREALRRFPGGGSVLAAVPQLVTAEACGLTGWEPSSSQVLADV